MTFSPAELKRGGRSLPTSRAGLAPAPNPALYLKSAERCFIMGITSVIDQTVKAIHSGEQRKKAAAEKFAPLKTRKFVSNGFDLAEEFLAYKVPRWVPQGLVAGVDSGFVAKRLASIDLVLIRAMGVVFDYENGVVKGTRYFPGYFRFPEPHLSNNALEEDEAEQSKSLMRLYEEVNAAKALIRDHSPKYCFI